LILSIVAADPMACTVGSTSEVFPQRDAEGRVVRWYNLAMDIDEKNRSSI